MRVTPVKKKFGKYAPGDEFDFPDKAAKVFVKLGKLAEVNASGLGYQTRMMQAAPVTVPVVNGHGAAPVEQSTQSPEPMQPETAAEAAAVETDSENVAWDASLHVATKLKNSDGTWRKKPGARAAS